MPKLISALELARRAGLSHRHISRMAALGRIPGGRKSASGAHWVFELNHELEAWICFQRIRRRSHAHRNRKASKQGVELHCRDWRGLLAIYKRLLGEGSSQSGTRTLPFSEQQDESARWLTIERILTGSVPMPPTLRDIMMEEGLSVRKNASDPPKTESSATGSNAAGRSRRKVRTEGGGRKPGKKSRRVHSLSRDWVPSVALNIHDASSYGRPMINGILDYLRRNPRWNIPVVADRAFLSISQLTKWRGDGIIGEFYNREAVRNISCLAIPAVNTTGVHTESSFPTVFQMSVDNEAVGILAADHLSTLGRSDYLFIGDKCEYSKVRYAAFRRRINESGER